MSSDSKGSRSVSAFGTVTVATHEVNVAIEGIDLDGIPGSFSVHLLRDGQRIASRFLFQPSPSEGSGRNTELDRMARFDFVVPMDAVVSGTLSVEVEPAEPGASAGPMRGEQLGRPTMSVCLLLRSQ